MTELTRFTIIRNAKGIKGEGKARFGISIEQFAMSDFYKALVHAGCNKQAFTSILINRLNQAQLNAELPQSWKQALHPVIKYLLEWMQYVSRPVTSAVLNSFLQVKLQNFISTHNLQLPAEADWDLATDLLMVCITQYYKLNSFREDYENALRLRVLFKMGLKTQGEFEVILSEKQLKFIFEALIVLPSGLLKKRCCEDLVGKEGTLFDPFEEGSKEFEKKSLKKGKDECSCECNENCQDPSNHCICIRPYVGELMIVKEEMLRYEEGDIAYIENILAGETKKREHRTLQRVETTSSDEREISESTEHDLQRSEQFSLSTEVAKTVEADLSAEAGVTYSQKFGPSMQIQGNAQFSANYAKSESESIAKSYASDVVDRSVTNLSEKISSKLTEARLNEVEEYNKHKIINEGGHKAGLYYWVNKVTKAQIFSYGKRMMFDLYIPEPASIYKHLMQLNQEQDASTTKPKTPEITLQSITRSEYAKVAAEHGVTATSPPPDQTAWITFNIAHGGTEGDKEITTAFSTEIQSEPIPDGYKAVRMEYSIAWGTGHALNTDSQTGDEKDEMSLSVMSCGHSLVRENFNQREDSVQESRSGIENSHKDLNGEEGAVSATITGFSTTAITVAGSISIQCDLKPEAFEAWQLGIYNAIFEEHYKKMEAYEMGQAAIEPEKIKGKNPFLNRETEKNELKRHVIATLGCRYFNGIGSTMSKVSPCGYPEVDFRKMELDSPVIQFFEQVIDWNYMTYLFYHSMWARKCKWDDLIDEDSGDPLFDKFLTSGAARVQVPVREGSENLFNYFLATGQIWGPHTTPPILGDEGYVSILQEIIESKQGDYAQREGLISAEQGKQEVLLTGSTYYWSELQDNIHQERLSGDVDRQILIGLKIYRLTSIEMGSTSEEWILTLDRPFESDTSDSYKHAIGAKFIGAPWEVTIPTQLVYLRNTDDRLPKYPLEAL